MLRVGTITLTAEEVERDVTALSEYLKAMWDPANGSRYFPLLVDYSMDSHLALLAMGRLGISCALIDSRAPSHQLKHYLEQVGETRAYKPSELFVAARSLAQMKGLRARRRVAKGRSDHAWSRAEGSCVIFTSGSAGRPNGVVFRWADVFDIISASSRNESMVIGREVVLNLQPLHWSVGFFHVLSAHGGNTVITLDPMSMSTGELLREISLASPTTIYLGADFARVLGKALAHYEGNLVTSVSRFAVGAGALRWEDLLPYRRFIPPDAEFVHTYGASEAVGMMAYSSRFGDTPLAGQVPLGRPRTQGGIRFVPTDEPLLFEVYASTRIASGYLDPGLTHQRFSHEPDGRIWWRSGDQLRLDPDTNEFYFFGRLDDLVKISDQRISLVEIEAGLRAYPGVTDVVVRVMAFGKRDRIVAFVQPAPGGTFVESAVAAFLEKMLVAGRNPYLILPLAQIPYTSRHKPDTDKLRVAAEEALASPPGKLQGGLVAPPETRA